MKIFRRSLFWGLVLAALGLPLGYVVAQQPNYGQTLGPGSAFNATIENYLYGGPQLALTNLTGCVTGGSPTLVGNNMGALVTAGTTASTTCTITWPVVRSVAPQCVIQGRTAAAGVPVVTVMSTSALTWTFTSTASTVWDIVCSGPR